MKGTTFFTIALIVMVGESLVFISRGDYFLTGLALFAASLCIIRYIDELKKEVWDGPYNYLLKSNLGKNYLGEPKEGWRVVTAANRDRESGLIVVGARHFDHIMRAQMFALSGTEHSIASDWQNTDFSEYLSTDSKWKSSEQGFIDNYGDFLTRAEAYVVAKHADQFTNQWKTNDHENYLFSENIH